MVQKKKWNWFVRKRKEREREKRAFAYFLFLSFHLPDLISTCCNLIKNYERWGGKGSLRVTRRIHARIVLHGSRRIFSNWDPRKSAKKNKKEKKMVQKDPPLSSASPAFFFSQRKMEITATESLPNPSDRRSTTAFLVIPLDFNSTFDLAGLSLELYRCRITRRTSPGAIPGADN